MLQQIGSVDKIPEFIERAKDKDDPFRLMGFGHRVYKNYDPRAGVLKSSADEVLDELGKGNNPKLAIAKELERIALEDDYFRERKLFPNVDFYSGIILEAMGIPTKMFTAIFALARTVGWIAQWNEMIEDPEQKIGRPRQLYTGHAQRPFVPHREARLDRFEEQRAEPRRAGAGRAGLRHAIRPLSRRVLERPRRVLGRQQPGAEHGISAELAVDQRPALVPVDAELALLPHDLELQQIAGPDRPAKARVLDPEEVDQIALAGASLAGDDERCCGLRHGLDDQHARHDRISPGSGRERTAR